MADIFVIASDYFQNPQQNGDLIPTDNAGTIDLFTEYSKVSIDLVKQTSEFIMFSGEDYHIENANWSREKILTSCEEKLHDKILETTRN